MYKSAFYPLRLNHTPKGWIDALNAFKQGIKNASNEGDGAARNPWHHIGGAHGHALKIGQQIFQCKSLLLNQYVVSLMTNLS